MNWLVSCSSGAHGLTESASEKRADAVHSHGEKSRGWISRFFPSAETVDKVRGGGLDW